MTEWIPVKCTVCDRWISEGAPMADHFVYSLGELDYIELAHFVCGQLNNVEMNSTYWKFDWPKAETPVQEGAMFLKQAD